MPWRVRLSEGLGIALDALLAAGFAVLRVAEVATNDQDSYVTADLSVDHGVGEVVQRVHSPQIICRSTNAWKLDQELGHALELVQEAVRELCAPFLAIEPRCLKEVKFCASVEAVAHPRLARMRATASGPETSAAGSASASASRLAASSFQRASRARSASRLVIT